MSDLSRINLGVLELRDGKPITRDMVCVCGKPFTQSVLSMRMVESAERMGHLKALQNQVPGFWVPKYCPPCERKDLALEARRVEIGTNRGAA